ncbi:MAG: TetR/AcrR family transcriptional regulator [Planctomycetaceae bacterium]|nr:TetR/AcrR family transcriptional regulator [Planctomycetaceae bacterium]
MARKDLRLAGLLAAEKIVTTRGIGAATYENVAREAGVSKGGLLHHFPTKRELILATFDNYVDVMRRRREEIRASLPEGRTSLVRAVVLTTFEYLDNPQNAVNAGIGMLVHPDYRARLSPIKRESLSALTDSGVRPELASAILSGLDGIWLNRGIVPRVMTDEVEQQVRREIIALVEQAEAEAEGDSQETGVRRA